MLAESCRREEPLIDFRQQAAVMDDVDLLPYGDSAYVRCSRFHYLVYCHGLCVPALLPGMA